MIVGCLPSFAVFIRGRVTASRAQYEVSSNRYPSGHNSKSQSRRHTGSMGSQEANHEWQSPDTASDKSLVEGGIIVTQTWAQSWQTKTGQKPEKTVGLETDYELEIVSGRAGNQK